MDLVSHSAVSRCPFPNVNTNLVFKSIKLSSLKRSWSDWLMTYTRKRIWPSQESTLRLLTRFQFVLSEFMVTDARSLNFLLHSKLSTTISELYPPGCLLPAHLFVWKVSIPSFERWLLWFTLPSFRNLYCQAAGVTWHPLCHLLAWSRNLERLCSFGSSPKSCDIHAVSRVSSVATLSSHYPQLSYKNIRSNSMFHVGHADPSFHMGQRRNKCFWLPDRQGRRRSDVHIWNYTNKWTRRKCSLPTRVSCNSSCCFASCIVVDISHRSLRSLCEFRRLQILELCLVLLPQSWFSVRRRKGFCLLSLFLRGQTNNHCVVHSVQCV